MFQTEIFKIINEVDGNTFLFGDNHFNHTNVMKYEPTRVEQMKKEGETDHNEWMIKNWNSKVKKNDLVLYLGDFAAKGIPGLKGKLNGRKILILGNHDRKGPEVYKEIFFHTIKGVYLKRKDRLYISESKDELFSVLIFEFKGKKILFSHYPATESEKKIYPVTGKIPETKKIKNQIMRNRIDEIIKIAKEEKIEYNIHGHKHSRQVKDDTTNWKFINCSLESIGFAPKKLKDIMKDHI